MTTHCSTGTQTDSAPLT
nr:unnamed protein product [Callosobruchus chinensis]